jgi:hypothetical protein
LTHPIDILASLGTATLASKADMTVETIGGAKIDIDFRVLEEVFGVDDGAVNTLGVAFRPVSILVGKAVLDARPAGHGASRWEKPRAVLLIAAYCVAVR